MIKIKKHNATVSVGRAELLHFKNFTEQYGHFSGPKTMRKIALFRKRNNESSNSTKSLYCLLLTTYFIYGVKVSGKT